MEELSRHPDPDSTFRVVLKLIQEAGNPYFDWFFGSSDRATQVLASWVRRSSSEVSTEQVTIALSGGELVGMFIGLTGSAVQRSRKADAIASLVDVGDDPAQRSALLEKLKETKNLFVAVESSEYYLSKIGFVHARRGRAFGKALTSEFLASGRRFGFYRFRLDVSADNERAIRMYRSFGFVIDSCRFAAGMRYLSMTLSDKPPGGTVRLRPSGLAEPVRFERLGRWCRQITQDGLEKISYTRHNLWHATSYLTHHGVLAGVWHHPSRSSAL